MLGLFLAEGESNESEPCVGGCAGMSPRLPRKAPNRRFVGYGSHEKLPMIKYHVLKNATDVTST